MLACERRLYSTTLYSLGFIVPISLELKVILLFGKSTVPAVLPESVKLKGGHPAARLSVREILLAAEHPLFLIIKRDLNDVS